MVYPRYLITFRLTPLNGTWPYIHTYNMVASHLKERLYSSLGSEAFSAICIHFKHVLCLSQSVLCVYFQSVLCVVFSLCYVESVVCVMCSF